MGTSTDTTGYGTGEFGAMLAKVTDCSRSPHPGSVRVDIGEEGVVSMGAMVDGCNEDGEEGVAGKQQTCSWEGMNMRRALVNRSAAAPSITMSLSVSDRVKLGYTPPFSFTKNSGSSEYKQGMFFFRCRGRGSSRFCSTSV